MAGSEKLTPKQRLFVAEYLKDLNATQAAIRCGYSEATATTQGPRLLENVGIKSAIEEGIQAREKRVLIDADWLLKRLADEATADISDLYDPETGALKPVKEWPLIWRQGLVQGVEVEQLFDDDGEGGKAVIGTVRKIKLDNRVKRLELIGKHVTVGAFEERIKVTGLDGLAERVARGKTRAT